MTDHPTSLPNSKTCNSLTTSAMIISNSIPPLGYDSIFHAHMKSIRKIYISKKMTFSSNIKVTMPRTFLSSTGLTATGQSSTQYVHVYYNTTFL